MAESKTVDSEIYYDFNCSVCIREKSAFSEAVYYCSDCNEYFCKQCFFNFGCEHGALGRAKVDKWGKPSQRIHFDECRQHKTNTVQLYCPKEDVVCCAICGQTRHKNCGSLQYIPLVVSGKSYKESLKTVQKDLQQLQKQVERLYKDRKGRQSDIDSLHKQLTDEIRRVKAQAIAILDDLEQRSLAEVNQFKADVGDKITTELNELDDIKSQLSDLQSRLKSHNVEESLMFARLKQGKELVRNKTGPLSQMSSTKFPDRAQFRADGKLEEYLNSLQGLGALVTDTKTDKPQTGGAGKVSKQARGQNLGRSGLNKPYKVTKKTNCNVRSKDDKEACNILGMCQLPDGSIVVTDNKNKSLKQLDSTYTVTRHCPLSACPYDVCNTEAGEVAVALNGNTIQFVSVGASMVTTRSFATSHYCHSLAYHNRRLYVVPYGGSSVHVYEPSGSLLYTISTDRHGTPLFSCTYNITVNRQVPCLHVADVDKGLVTVDLEGELLATCGQPDLARGARAVCLDDAGNVFVKENVIKRVLQVGREGDSKVAEIVSPSDGISAWMLCFDAVNTRLLVTSNASSCDNIHVLQLSQ